MPSKEPLSKHVYKDPKIVKTFDHKAVQTERNKRLGSQSSLSEDIDQEAYDLMVSGKIYMLSVINLVKYLPVTCKNIIK